MFGIPSIGKMLVLVAVIMAIWFGFKLIGRLDAQRKAAAKRQAKDGRVRARRRKTDEVRMPVPDAEDMVQCPVCKSYVAARGAGSCGRSDCPY
jgi:uncharacterized protein